MKIKKFDSITYDVLLFHNKTFPLYIIKGDKNFLIDAGVTTLASTFVEDIKSQLGENKLDTLLLTHSHWDHTGAASILQETFNFDVKGSQRAVDLLQKPKVIKFINRLNQDYKDQLDDESDAAFTLLKDLSPVKEGDRVEISAGRFIEVFETPGHTQCSASYLLHPEMILFPGDAAGVVETDGSVKPLFLSSYKNYEDSLKKLINIEAEVLAFPHNRYLRGKDVVAGYLARSLERTQQTKDEILTMLSKTDDYDVIAEELMRKEFPKPTLLGPREALMINFKAMANAVNREFSGN
jgi:glyoxylase-like metal-dependent hydrolase (beta-lactamase superfamily II)